MALNMNKHTFKGHKTLLGNKYVTYGEIELPSRYELYAKSNNGFNWGHNGSGTLQLAFSILYQVSDKKTAQDYAIEYAQDVIRRLNSRDWKLSAHDVTEWLALNKKTDNKADIKKEVEKKEPVLKLVTKQTSKPKKKKTNVVKSICEELKITQKQLAEILEVPEGTVSSWAVKNEIPRLGKKAIEFYTLSTRNQKIVDSYKDFMQLLHAS